jgi:NADPH2:quinone reductase
MFQPFRKVREKIPNPLGRETMRAVQMTAAGGPEMLQLREVSDPQIQSKTETLVRLRAAGINPVDAKQRGRGPWYPGALPVILGIDGAGIVEEVGQDVKSVKRGDEVFFAHGGFGKLPGNYAEFTVVEERFLAHKPSAVSFVEAAAATSSCITAWECLFYLGQLQRGQHVLIQAGAGGVGHIAVQLAREKGARIATTVNTEQKAQLVRECGADRVIFYEEEDFVEQTLEWTTGNGVDLTIDLVGKETFYKSFSATRFYGTIVTLLGPDPQCANWQEARLRNQQVKFYLMLTPMYYDLVDQQVRQTKILGECARMMAEGKLRIHVSKTFPLEEAAHAHRLIETGDTIGKVVLEIP